MAPLEYNPVSTTPQSGNPDQLDCSKQQGYDPLPCTKQVQHIGWPNGLRVNARTLAQYQLVVRLYRAGLPRSGRSPAVARRVLHLRAACAEGWRLMKSMSLRLAVARDGPEGLHTD